jgi:hypothetical protein
VLPRPLTSSAVRPWLLVRAVVCITLCAWVAHYLAYFDELEFVNNGFCIITATTEVINCGALDSKPQLWWKA